MSYFFHPAAEAEYLESIAYYESKRPGLGATYLGEFERVMDAICEAPHRNPVERRPDVRRMRMKRFPFTVLYRENANTVQVLAVAHNRRRPQYWLGRL
ncbi:MAG: type II toxin-antitoxin system RelE/ParE family toxin [Thiohalocapsa sp. PB-PSB1]|jgi:toxin ParE1/3/4|nr:MAG: type II toxin-antitoxin system RelE/ParE family toxin [Thiohalocapsa sp. PB-PSB1]